MCTWIVRWSRPLLTSTLRRGGGVDRFERGRRFAGELEDHEVSPVAVLDPAQLDMAQDGVEIQRAVQVGDAVGDEECLHAAYSGRRTW